MTPIPWHGWIVRIGMLSAGLAHARDEAALIASAESAGPALLTAKAMIEAADGTVLRDGSNGYACYPQQETIGSMCNEPIWDELIGAMSNKRPFEARSLSISYMLAGEGTAVGVSDSDPYASDRHSSQDWVKEGPHLTIIVPDRAMLEGPARGLRAWSRRKNSPPCRRRRREALLRRPDPDLRSSAGVHLLEQLGIG